MLTEIITFVRTVELKSISAAARELRVTPGSASTRIMSLEDQLGVRLLNRTTRQVQTTEAGDLFYPHALEVIRAVDQAKASVTPAGAELTGVLRVAAPLGFGRRILAPMASQFQARHPRVEVRLRLSDHDPDLVLEAADLAIRAGRLPQTGLVARKLADCPQVLCASPDYLDGHPVIRRPQDLLAHNCLAARTQGRERAAWMFQTPGGALAVPVAGRLEADDAAVLIDWALAGEGVLLAPLWEVSEQLRDGRLQPVCVGAEPEPLTLSLVYPSKRMLPVKGRTFIDFFVRELGPRLREAESLAAAAA
jgi:DNA-binding transcriptional LysR family regulator